MKFLNPFAFRPGPVSFWTTVIYLALIIPLIYVHETVPPTPAKRSLDPSLNLTEAWSDLQRISKAYHPYNSHENDRVREFLIQRTKAILGRNGVGYKTEATGGTVWRDSIDETENKLDHVVPKSSPRTPGATLFDDQISNVTWTYDTTNRLSSSIGKSTWAGQYFEGNNYYVYIHGKEDPEGDWWRSESKAKKFKSKGGVLVNCHFDSVASGYGATDDGMACVSMLQLLSYFTSEGHQPTNGIVLLFNNAEEDGLLGARAFGYSPLLKFCHTFVNLEGAGAGGRAILFRTTDLQTAQAYSKSPHPFGSVVAANAFERGVIKSATDYEIWSDVYGQRGLDIAFYAPRAQYHTDEDDVRHTSVNSIWHMLSAALASTKHLSQTTGSTFNGARSDGRKDLAQNGKQTAGVWFDMFGDAWAAFALRGLFAWSLTLLIATPLILVAMTYLLIRNDKYYYFSRDMKTNDELNDDTIPTGGWKGFFRFPVAFVLAAALTIASVFLLAKFNPFIIYSSSYAVWAMTLSLFYFVFWLIMRGSSFVRPSALHRGFVNIWLFALGWGVQVFAAVAEDRMQIGALYSSVFLQSAVFLSLLISLLEQFGLSGKGEFIQDHYGASARDREEYHDNPRVSDEGEQRESHEDDSPEPTETTPLRTGEHGHRDTRPSFANTYRRSVVEVITDSSTTQTHPPYDHEQSWSGRLPTWTWFIQFLLLAPIPVIMIGNLGLIAMSSLRMTGTDGGSLLTPLLALGVISILILLPLSPFIHRVTHHVPMFLLLVFIGTLIYNLAAFPFSANHRFKFYFQQVIDLDQDTNTITLSGIEEYTRAVIKSIPSAAGQDIQCHPTPGRDLMDCTYDGSAVVPKLARNSTLQGLISVTFPNKTEDGTATLSINALDTRTCYLKTSRPIYGFSVAGGGTRDPRFGTFPSDGLQNIQIWRRDRTRPWTVTFDLTEKDDSAEALGHVAHETNDDELQERSALAFDEPLEVRVSCAWSDANEPAKIPAFQELRQYIPTWAVTTKKSVGLVEVRKTYKVSG